MTGQLILVTGTSGAGKTTSCREFALAADDLWLHFSVDLFYGTLVPRQYVDGGPKCTQGLHVTPDDPANPDGPRHLELGPDGPAMTRAFHEMIAAAVRSGTNVIVDHILTQHPPFLQDCLSRFKDLPVLLVALKTPEELLDGRIKGRIEEHVKTSPLSEEHIRKLSKNLLGVKVYMLGEIFSHDNFDLIVDTGTLTPGQVVEKIMARWKKGPGEAWGKLAKMFDLSKDPF